VGGSRDDCILGRGCEGWVERIFPYLNPRVSWAHEVVFGGYGMDTDGDEVAAVGDEPF